ncbi:gastrula zinc finger protein XlCGF57.1-like isoform X3 [Etheostoma cragini]|uniref:gastrula zinc finger protein XlCGF57.1-like isoform X3 n=1 Tax=Etheostoma cragini TaxID=417921 RepID=UPI00155E7791|nr:gastrula zinc finger protein XlCGF57.1-like isoform X3 [Etheostoma cragini]
MGRHRRPLEETKLRGEALPPDVLKVIVGKEEPQECSSSVDQQEPEYPPHIKEEPEELWSSQEGKQIEGREEADITKFPFTPVPIKSEDDEEEAQSSQLHQRKNQHMETEADGEDFGGPEPARNSHPLLQPETDDSVDSDFWKETRPRSFSCSNCGKTFACKADLKTHMKCHTGEKTYSCSVCKKSFTQSWCLQKHMRVHTGEKPFSCSECGKAFTQKLRLQIHMAHHTGEKPYSCVVCERRFPWSTSLNVHQCVGSQTSQLHQRQAQHMETEADGKDCGGPEPARNLPPLSQPDSSDPETDDSADWKETRDPQSALNSLKHDSRCKKPFSCSKCGKRFGFKSHLKTHMISHTGEKPFSCSVCKKYFTQSGHLQKHMRTHTGEKPFSCSVCNKSFTQSENLRSHMRNHTGEKPFSCSECGRAFSENGTLKKHMITHTGEKPFSCSVCSKRFGYKSALKKHMRTHTGDQPFRCSECGEAFTENGHLKTHMRTHTAVFVTKDSTGEVSFPNISV